MTTQITLTPKEQHLIEYMRALGFGTLERIVVQNGEPVSAEVVKATAKF